MSILIHKSEENYQAIDMLIHNKLNAPVIHCAYYSSLQLVIHYFYLYCEISEEEAEREARSGSGSHNYYLNKLVDQIKKIDRKNALEFYKYFSVFKRKRTEADYKNIKIEESDLLQAKESAMKVRKFFKLIDHEGKCENIHYI